MKSSTLSLHLWGWSFFWDCAAGGSGCDMAVMERAGLHL